MKCENELEYALQALNEECPTLFIDDLIPRRFKLEASVWRLLARRIEDETQRLPRICDGGGSMPGVAES